MVHNKKEVVEVIQSIAQDVIKLGAERLGLFGSFVRDKQSAESDIDLVVEFKSGMKTYRNYIDLAYLLEEKLERKVDLLTWEGMASFVQRDVRKEIEYVPLTD